MDRVLVVTDAQGLESISLNEGAAGQTGPVVAYLLGPQAPSNMPVRSLLAIPLQTRLIELLSQIQDNGNLVAAPACACMSTLIKLESGERLLAVVEQHLYIYIYIALKILVYVSALLSTICQEVLHYRSALSSICAPVRTKTIYHPISMS
jgi:hypothetical protein